MFYHCVAPNVSERQEKKSRSNVYIQPRGCGDVHNLLERFKRIIVVCYNSLLKLL